MHVPQQIISKLGGEMVFDAGATRIEGWACPECGARVHTESGAAVIKQTAGEYWTETAIRAVLPTQHDCTVQLLKARAVDETQVVEMMQDPTLLDHMVEVETGTKGRPLRQWCHDDSWTIEDRGELHQAQFDRRVDIERRIDADLAQLKREKLTAMGY